MTDYYEMKGIAALAPGARYRSGLDVQFKKFNYYLSEK